MNTTQARELGCSGFDESRSDEATEEHLERCEFCDTMCDPETHWSQPDAGVVCDECRDFTVYQCGRPLGEHTSALCEERIWKDDPLAWPVIYIDRCNGVDVRKCPECGEAHVLDGRELRKLDVEAKAEAKATLSGNPVEPSELLNKKPAPALGLKPKNTLIDLTNRHFHNVFEGESVMDSLDSMFRMFGESYRDGGSK